MTNVMDMSGSTLKVVVAHRPPFVFVANGSAGQPAFHGLLIDLLHKILATSEDPINYDIYVSPVNAGGAVVNGNWTGVIGELVEGRADVALFPLTRTAARLTAIDCTFSYLDSGLGMLVMDSETSPGALSVLAPFAMTLWVTLLCTVIGVSLLFWALDVYGRWIRSKQLAALRASGALSEKAMARAKKDDGNPVLISFMAAAGAPERPGRASWGVQVLYVVYCFFCLIVLSAYTANLTSYLAVQRSAVGIAGLQDLVRDGSLIGVNPNGSTAAYFFNSQDTLATQLQPNIRFCATETCVAWLRAGKVSAFISDAPALTYISQQRPCDLAVVGDVFGPGNLVIGLQKNSTLIDLFNSAIQGLSEDGTLTSLRRAWFQGLSQCKDTDVTLENSRLTVGQMLGAFVFLLIGVLVAFFTGTVENLKWCLAKAYARSASEMTTQTSRFYDASRRGDPSVHGGPAREGSRTRNGTWRRISSTIVALTHRSIRGDLEANILQPDEPGPGSPPPSGPVAPAGPGNLAVTASRPLSFPYIMPSPLSRRQTLSTLPPRPPALQQQPQRLQQPSPLLAPRTQTMTSAMAAAVVSLQPPPSSSCPSYGSSRVRRLTEGSPLPLQGVVVRTHLGATPGGGGDNSGGARSPSGSDDGGSGGLPSSVHPLLPMFPSIAKLSNSWTVNGPRPGGKGGLEDGLGKSEANGKGAVSELDASGGDDGGDGGTGEAPFTPRKGNKPRAVQRKPAVRSSSCSGVVSRPAAACPHPTVTPPACPPPSGAAPPLLSRHDEDTSASSQAPASDYVSAEGLAHEPAAPWPPVQGAASERGSPDGKGTGPRSNPQPQAAQPGAGTCGGAASCGRVGLVATA